MERRGTWVRLSNGERAQLDALARGIGVKRSVLIQQAVRDWLRKQHRDPRPGKDAEAFHTWWSTLDPKTRGFVYRLGNLLQLDDGRKALAELAEEIRGSVE